MLKIFEEITDVIKDLGNENFKALLDKGNREKVKEFCKTLVITKSQTSESLPIEMKVGDRTYEILGFLKEGEKNVVGHEMVKRAKEMNAHLGQDDGQYLLDHQQDIPVALRGNVIFIFTDCRHPDNSDYVYGVCWVGDRWIRDWSWLGYGVYFRVLRRK